MSVKYEHPRREQQGDGERETHPAYGMIGLSRTSSNGFHLAGSSIRHSNFLCLTIKEAERHFSHGRDWWFGRGVLAEVWISGTQLADMLTGMNVGDGVPCTIRYGNGTERPLIEDLKTPQTEATEYLRGQLDKTLGSARELVKLAERIAKETPGMKKADREELKTLLTQMGYGLDSNLTYAAKCFDEKMEHTVKEAKGEVEAFVSSKIIAAGIKSLGGEYKPVQIED